LKVGGGGKASSKPRSRKGEKEKPREGTHRPNYLPRAQRRVKSKSKGGKNQSLRSVKRRNLRKGKGGGLYGGGKEKLEKRSEGD